MHFCVQHLRRCTDSHHLRLLPVVIQTEAAAARHRQTAAINTGQYIVQFQCVCDFLQLLKPTSDPPTDAPRGSVRLCTVPDALEPAAETGPAAPQPSHQLGHVR